AHMGGERGALAFRSVERTDEDVGGRGTKRGGERLAARDEMRFGARRLRRAGERTADKRAVVQDDRAEPGERHGEGRIALAERAAKRQVNAEERAPALLALDLDAAAHGDGKTLRDREAEAGAFVAARMGLIGLR